MYFVDHKRVPLYLTLRLSKSRSISIIFATLQPEMNAKDKVLLNF